ncbi:MAG: LapA family protein [Betaproteobacteria bacterium]
MRIRTLFLILLGCLITTFAALNWAAFTVPSTLSVGVTTIEAPLGLTLLSLLVLMTLVFAAYAAFWQGAVLLDARRHAKEMQLQRQLADQAEASRFTELRSAFHAELIQLSEVVSALQDALRVEIHENTNSLAAMIGEMGGRLAAARLEPTTATAALVRP